MGFTDDSRSTLQVGNGETDRDRRLRTLYGAVNNSISDERFNQNVRTLLENHECNTNPVQSDPKYFLMCHYALGERRSQSKCLLIDYHNLRVVSEYPVQYGRNGVAMTEGRRGDARTPLGVFQADKPRAKRVVRAGDSRFYSGVSGP